MSDNRVAAEARFDEVAEALRRGAAARCVEEVVAVPAPQVVAPVPATKGVIALVTLERVVARAADERVVAAAALELVIVVASNRSVGEIGEAELETATPSDRVGSIEPVVLYLTATKSQIDVHPTSTSTPSRHLLTDSAATLARTPFLASDTSLLVALMKTPCSP